jgi:hypothetical protein
VTGEKEICKVKETVQAYEQQKNHK